MGSFVKGFFGQSTSRSSSALSPRRQLKGVGSIGAFGGNRAKINIQKSGPAMVRLTGGIADARRDAFDRTKGIIGDVQGDIQGLRSLENPFIRARVRPFEDSLQRGLDDRERALARRGVFGTFGTQELDRVRREGGREIADQTALAQMEALQAIFQRQAFQQSLTQNLRGFTQDEVQQSLAELGLIVGGSQVVNRSQFPTGGTRTQQGDPSQGIASALSAVGKFF